MKTIITSSFLTMMLLITLVDAPEVVHFFDEAYKLTNLDAQVEADSAAGTSTDVTSNINDSSWLTTSGTIVDSAASSKDEFVTLRYNKDAESFGSANLSLWITNPSVSPQTVVVYSYQSNGDNINSGSNVSFDIDTSNNKIYNISVTTIMHTMDGYGWIKFRITADDAGKDIFEIADARLELDDDVSPSITFGLNPINYLNTTTQTHTFEAKCTENDILESIQIWGDWSGGWSAKEINVSPHNNSYWNKSIAGIPEGGWVWGVMCNDSAGNEGWSSINRSLTIDLTEPSVDYAAPTEQNNSNISYNYFYVNASFEDSLTDGDTCLIDLYNSSGEKNYTMNLERNSTGGHCFYNVTDQTDYRINYSVYVNDSADNFKESEIRYHTIDTVQPTVTFGTNPINNTNTSLNSLTFEMKCSDTMTGIDYLELWGDWTGIWSMNETNTTPIDNVFWYVSVVDIPEGGWTWGIRCNDSAGNEVWSSINRTFTVNKLEVELITPNPLLKNNVAQNATFVFNATVVCNGGNCGYVNGSVWYNETSEVPDTLISMVESVPFYIQETSAISVKSCPTNPLDNNGEFCNISWIINASGDVDGSWKMGALFNTTQQGVFANNTKNATVDIVAGVVDVTTYFSSVNFGNLLPNRQGNAAEGNNGVEYNISVNSGSGNTDIYINGSDLINQSLGVIGVGNISWSNTTNNYEESYDLETTKIPVKLDVPPSTNVTMWFWLDTPVVYAGNYNGSISITSVENGESP